MPERRDCGGVRILDFAVGQKVESRDPGKSRGEVIAVRKYDNAHDAIHVRFDEDGAEWWQDGFWFRIL